MNKTSKGRTTRFALASLSAAVTVAILMASQVAVLWAQPPEESWRGDRPNRNWRSDDDRDSDDDDRRSGRRRRGHGHHRRPNFVVILTDDMDAKSLQQMPRTQALIGGCGATFNNSFVVNPICTPSNVCMLTGQYCHNHQIFHNPPPLGGFQKFIDTGGEASNLATWMHDAGYLTGRVGKYLIGYDVGETHVPPGWDDWHCFYGGFSPYFNYSLNENGVVVPYGNAESDYMTDVLARRAEEFIEAAESHENKPFFLVFATSAPHSGAGRNGPPDPAPRHAGSFAGWTAPRTPSFNEEDVSDKPEAVQNLPLLTPERIAAIDREYQLRLESLQAVDEAVHRIVAKLHETGELDNTYIFFTSDNGYHLGQHRFFGGKGEAYDEDIRVPLLVRGPGIPAGVTREHFALNIDIAPTITDIARVAPGRMMDGESLAPVFDRHPPPLHHWRNDFLVEIYRAPGQPGLPTFGLRNRHVLYTENEAGFRELYDMHRDPYQLENLAESAHPWLLDLLSQRLAELKGCAGGDCGR